MNHIYIGDRQLDPDEEPDLPISICDVCDGNGSTNPTYSDPLGDECPKCQGAGEIEMTYAELEQKAFDDFDPPDADCGGDE